MKTARQPLSQKRVLNDFAWPWRQPVPEFEWMLAGHDVAKGSYSCLRDKPARSWGLFYPLKGHSYFRSAGQLVKACPHQVVLIEPNCFHDYGKDPSSSASLEVLWLHFSPRPEWLRFLDWPRAAPGIRTLKICRAMDRRICPRILRNVVGCANRNTFADGLAAMHGLEEFVLFCHTIYPEHECSSLDTRIGDLAMWMKQNLRLDPSVAEMARRSGRSVSHFAHAFRKQTGQSPRDFLNHLKMQEARHLLENTTLRMSTIADQSGFGNPYHFSKRFRQVTGKSPSEYRKIHGLAAHQGNQPSPPAYRPHG